MYLCCFLEVAKGVSLFCRGIQLIPGIFCLLLVIINHTKVKLTFHCAILPLVSAGDPISSIEVLHFLWPNFPSLLNSNPAPLLGSVALLLKNPVLFSSEGERKCYG